MEKGDNELIAEFMGARGKIIDGEFRIDYKQEGMRHFWSTPRYHESWDWLMPVVEKINKLEDSGAFKGFDLDIIRSMHEWISLVSIINAYGDIVSIAKWYNSQPPRL